ncbi:aldehyde dehydrogenase [Candidatus Pacearchaeota archaeon]|nr:MAG: aldehyde dehydrogenase [Candidatus Pacearchaeota archaeon]
MKEYKNYIGGKWVDSVTGRKFEDRNPANWDEVIGIFPKSNAEDVEKAVEAAKKAYKYWKKVPVPKRGEIVRKAAELLLERKEEIARLMTREMGKILKETRGDVQEGIDTAFYAFGESRRLFGWNAPSELPDKYALTMRQPMGVWGIITPWNFPIAIPSWKIFPAILAGNTVVFKPATDTPACAAELVKILEEAGVPEGVVNIVFGSGSEVGMALLEHPDIVGISFTGSSDVGRKIAEIAGRGLKKISLELGGKNGQIVMDDADLELALEGVIWGAFGTTGQRCTATSRLIIHEAVYDKFLEMVVERAKQIKIGNGLDETVEMGPLINEAQREKVKMYVEIGKNEDKARLILGGDVPKGEEYEKGWFFQPTIFDNVNPSMRIAQEEIFGPVLSVFKVKSFEEAIEVLNSTNYGLSSSIYTRDLNKAMKAIEEIEAGIVYVNAPTIGAECHLPFGGIKNTGNGHREGGWTVYEIFTEWKTIYIDFSGKLQKAQIDTWEE